MTPSQHNQLKAQKKAQYELKKRINKRYLQTGQGATPTNKIEGVPYVQYSKYFKA